MARVGNRTALDEIIVRRFAQLSSDEAVKELEAAGVAYGRLNQIVDLSRHPHLRRVPVTTPSGTIQVVAPGQIFDEERAPRLRPVPALGEHSDALREEFGKKRTTSSD